jgi:hypothetical protein
LDLTGVDAQIDKINLLALLLPGSFLSDIQASPWVMITMRRFGLILTTQ